jgi:hypothetical protein
MAADPRTSALTRAHRAELGRLAAQAARQVRAIADRADTSNVAGWWAGGADRRAERVVAAGHRAAVALATRYLAQHAALSGATVRPLPAALDLEAARGSLFVASVGVFMRSLAARGGTGSESSAKRVMTASLAASAQRLVLAGDRDTVMGTFRAGR